MALAANALICALDVVGALIPLQGRGLIEGNDIFVLCSRVPKAQKRLVECDRESIDGRANDEVINNKIHAYINTFRVLPCRSVPRQII